MRQKLRIVLLITGLLTASCGSPDAPQSASAEQSSAAPDAPASTGGEGSAALESKTLRVGFSGQPDFTQIANFKWLEDMGTKHDVAAEDVIFEGTAPPFRALVAGEVEMVVGQVPPGVLLVTETGEDLVMIAGDVQASDYMLVSVQDLTSIEDLPGRTVGTAGEGAVSDSLTLAALQNEGIDTDAVEFLQIGGTGARMAALLSGQVDAAPAHFAEGYATVEEGLYDLYPVHEGIGPYLFHGVWTTRAWAEENPVLAQLAVDEFIETVRWAATSEEEYMAASETVVEGLSEAARRQAYAKFLEIDLFALNGGLEPELIDQTIAIEQQVGGLPEDIPEPDEWVYRDFVDSYLERFGEQ